MFDETQEESVEVSPVETVVEEATPEDTVEEAPKTTTRKRTRTKKVAEENSDAVVDVSVEAVEETSNDDGQEVITGPKKKKPARSSNMHSNPDGVVGSRAADRALGQKVEEVAEEVPAEIDEEQVAIWSKGNIRWTGVGSLSKGYNIVTKEAAEKWLTREGIREASPEEVATYYGK